MLYRKELQEWDGIQPYFWPLIARELPAPKKLPFLKAHRKGGRPRGDDRKALGAILWRVRCGGAWSRLPERFGPAITARRRLARWLKAGRLGKAWRAFLCQQSRNELERWQESFCLSSFRETPFWRFEMDLIWRLEFAPRVAPGEGE